jgi:ring-1,2-phenylacetyl-CoA epoxidase subunit PaaC
MEAGLRRIWPYVPELFASESGVDQADVRAEFDAVIDQVLAAAGLGRPEAGTRAGVSGRMGRDGVHTEAMGYLLAEMQSVARSLPGATW